MKWIGTLLLLFLYAFAQAQPTPSAIKAAALQMTKAIIHHKNEEIVPFMHPAVIQSAGGTAKALAMLDSANVYMNRLALK